MSRIAVATGGASGIGAVTASCSGSGRAEVAVLDRAGGITSDVADPGSVARAIGEVRVVLGPVDLVVNAAGVAAGGPIEDDAYPTPGGPTPRLIHLRAPTSDR